MVLDDRPRQVLARLNPALAPEAVEDALRRLTRPEGATPEARNRAVQHMLVHAVTVEYRFAALRDTLLPNLISGELRVEDAERIIGRCG